MAADLVRRHVSVIAATGTQAALAAKAATTTISIVFETAGDPIALGLVGSLNRPSRNVTGITQLSSELVAKRLSLLHDLVPHATTVGFLVNPTDPRFVSQTKDIQEAAKKFGVQIQVVNASTDAELESAFAELGHLRVSALVVGTGEFFNSRPEKIVGLADRQHIPAMYQYRRYAEVGGLISYGPNITDAYRQAGIYTSRDSQGRETRGPASCAGDKIRDGHQSQNCQNARAHNYVGRALNRRRGDRGGQLVDVRYWHKADIPVCTAYVRYWHKADMRLYAAHVRF